MKSADLPAKFPIPWANNAGSSYVRNIPEASQSGVQPGAASLTDGFPPPTFLPVGAGGIPPYGQDMNGILKQVTQWLRWAAAAGIPVPFDADFSTSVGGYPKSALVASVTTFGLYWLSAVDDNTTNPDAGGAGWVRFDMLATSIPTPRQTAYTPGSYTFLVPNGVYRVRLSLYGGGGGGGTSPAKGGGTYAGAPSGGGAGAFCQKTLDVSPGDTIAVVVGNSGARGSGTTNGTAGGNTTAIYDGITYTAGGGVGGYSASDDGTGLQAGGGTATNGDINLTGQGSQTGWFSVGSGTIAGEGGSALGPLGGWGGRAFNGAANDGLTPGGGGGGAPNGHMAGLGGAGYALIEY